MDELINIGKSTGVFGIKGEIKVKSDFEYIDKAFKRGNTILINNINHKISSVRYHKQYILITIDEIYDINKINDYIGYNIYIKRSDLDLSSDEYLYTDLIDSEVYDKDKYIGRIIDIEYNNSFNLVRVEFENKEYLIPMVNEYIDYFDKEKQILYTNDGSRLIL